jgi:uncharacterized Tic20 family protein
MAEENQTPEAAENSADEQTAQPVGTEKPEISKDATNMAMLGHLLAIFTGFLGPLIIWLIKKDEVPFVDRHGKEALNFQITVLIAMFAAGLLSFVCIGFFLMPIIWLVDMIFCILAALAASRGEEYRYPMAIRLVK